MASAAVAAAARTWLGGPLEIPPPWPAGAVSLWPGSQFVDVLWSSAGGLLATSPALYAAAVGLVWVRARDRRLGSAVLAGCALVAWATAIIPAQNAPAVRAFAVAVPLLAFGIAAFAAAMARAVAARPGATAVAALALLVVWNVTLMSVARTGGFGIGQPLVFSDVAARQAETLHGWIGHPWSYPANLVYAASNGVAPSRFDLLYPGRLFARADQVSGRIDIGGDDAVYVGPGWHGRESEGDETFRWARARAEVLVPLARTGAFVVRVHLRPFEPADHREQRLVLVVGDRALPSMTLAGGWQALEIDTPRSAWRRGVNHLELRFAWEARPSDQGQPDPRPLAAAVDAIELADSRPAPAP